MNDYDADRKNMNRTHVGISPTSNGNVSSSYLDDASFSNEYDAENVRGTRFFDIDVGENDMSEGEFIGAENGDPGFVVHDQLPSAEEAKFYNATTRRNEERKQMRSRKCFLWGIFLACIFSFGGIFLKKRHQRKNAITFVTKIVRLSHPASFRDSKSPQSRALQWMLYEDKLQLPLPLNRADPFVQRYIVAVMVFALTHARSKNSMSEEDLRETYGLLSGVHECDWNMVDAKGVTTGVVCRNDSDSVTDILFPRSGLAGELPPEMELLRHLVQLDMNNNLIRGQIPSMPYLTNLDLAYNKLTGYMPDHFSEMTGLQILSLSENDLQGAIPHTFPALTDLKVLALNGNQLTGGLHEIYSLSNLEEVYLFSNLFEDQLSHVSFQELQNLKVIDMKKNRLSGPLPNSLFSKLTHLEVIDFHMNALDGHINNIIAEDHPLLYMDISSNLLGGGLPTSIDNLRALTHLDLSYNRLETLLSNNLKNLKKLKTLLLTEDDQLGPQSIPVWLREMTDLTQLSFRLTSRTGTIPTWFGEMTHLELLDLDWNRISGTIPTELGRLTNLKYLMLNRNRLTGTIPTEVTSLPNLKMLMVDTNELTGSLLSGDEVTPDGENLVCAADETNRRIVDMVADCGPVGDAYGNVDKNAAIVHKEVDCPCCTSCCWDEVLRCNMKDWIIEVENEYRSGYRYDR
mmetsp:Transcript_27567/g.75216  ORF Transcript_27567/g.75216 Transcript_27567/m.75216 type:complete len:685 (+) Transcript_27567:254-2308(+)|eukprot:CAMPEP_0172365906 /NCGR_PEP_ID=MMETSP1060-20121228/12314_1 /TAXON_ID=37318 /ORGANISM="Pseudo-nitzschia pungens, Strain cf. cingulata" /LENGTH=684 /DNA_ID=CAMNT_0013089501 /DNA_START=226 /DNA_END=2280 /DNA_ORIENTATION=+